MSTIPSEVHKAEIAATPIDTKPIENRLAILHQRATSIEVKNPESYELACQIALDGRKEIKAIGFALDPGIGSAREHLETLRNRKNSFVNKVKPIVDLASGKAAAWREQERLAAEAEQKRINEENQRQAREVAERLRIAAERKAEADRKERQKEIEAARKAGEFGKRDANRLAKEAEAQAQRDRQAAREAEERDRQVKEVKVKPSIPKMAGIKGRTNWRWRWQKDGENELLDSFRENMSLRPFVQANEQQIGVMVRAAKGKKLAESECPGIEVYSEDSV
jgi:hypothetical protein